MGLSAERAERLLELEEDVRLMREVESERVDCRAITELVKRRQGLDPDFSFAALAKAAGYSSTIEVQRLLGVAPAARTVKNGRGYGGTYAQTIAVVHADRIAVALGYVLSDLEVVPRSRQVRPER